MDSPRSHDQRVCPKCGSDVPEHAAECWLCHAAIEPSRTAEDPPQATVAELADTAAATTPSTGNRPPAVSERRPVFQFGLASLLLFTTLVAVLLSAFTTFPGLGIALTILAVPALARTCFVAIRTRDRGQPMPVMTKIHVFLVTLGVATLIAVAVGATFYGTCWAGFFGGVAANNALGNPGGGYSGIVWGLWTGVILGIIAGLVVAFFLIRFCWRRVKS